MNYTMYDIGDKELAYIAGFFDGEGCIQIGGQGDLVVSASNTNLESLQFLMDVLGGRVRRLKPVATTRKTLYIWQIPAASAPEVLEMLLPYLIVKKQQALLAIEFSSAAVPRKLDIDLELRALKH